MEKDQESGGTKKTGNSTQTHPFEDVEWKDKFQEIKEAGNIDIQLYSDIERLIIHWSNDGTKTAGCLTRRIFQLLNDKGI